jgi:hypothetical protein
VVSASHVAECVRSNTIASRATLYSQSPHDETARLVISSRNWRPPGRWKREMKAVANMGRASV